MVCRHSLIRTWRPSLLASGVEQGSLTGDCTREWAVGHAEGNDRLVGIEIGSFQVTAQRNAQSRSHWYHRALDKGHTATRGIQPLVFYRHARSNVGLADLRSVRRHVKRRWKLVGGPLVATEVGGL
jgi:hypothetical protein